MTIRAFAEVAGQREVTKLKPYAQIGPELFEHLRQRFVQNGTFSQTSTDQTVLRLFFYLDASALKITSIQTSNNVAVVVWNAPLIERGLMKNIFADGSRSLMPGQRIEFTSNLVRTNNVWLIKHL